MNSPLTRFLAADGRDHAGRTFEDVMAFDDEALERHHDFIQWLFPLPEASRAVPGAPVLSADDIAVLRASPEAQVRLAQAAERMMTFYGRETRWRAPYDHNHLRITRIIKSLRLLAGDAAANDFRTRILALAEGAPIAAEARGFWAAA